MKIVNLLTISQFRDNDGWEVISNINNAVEIIVKNFHPVHTEITCIMLQILSEWVWRSDMMFHSILIGFSVYKREYGLKFRF